tara:strand:- start:689 stop:958 length:270 start_codon:yes stop_codon:yes gene_type:complete
MPTPDRCLDSEVWLTRDADKNAFGDGFRQLANVVPVVGPLFGNLVPDTLTQNVVRQCAGITVDRRSSFAIDYILLLIIVALLISYYVIK